MERKLLLKIGRLIPNKCWLQAKFNLPFTPCALNPFFPHLVALRDWAVDTDLRETLPLEIQNLFEKYGSYTTSPEQSISIQDVSIKTYTDGEPFDPGNLFS